MAKELITKFEITDEKHEGDGWRLIKNGDGGKYDYLEINLPQLGTNIRLEVMPDGKFFNVYSDGMIFRKKETPFNEIALEAITRRKEGNLHSND